MQLLGVQVPRGRHPVLLQLVQRSLCLFSPCSDKVRTFLVSILIIPFRYTSVEREELLYPKSTMVAEVGGTLGLFLGISFMTIWDGAVKMKEYFGFFKSFLPDSMTEKEKN